MTLAGLAALTAFLRHRTGMDTGPVLIFIAAVGLVGLVWVIFVVVAWALVVS
jgi:hypothetical protein